MNFEYYTEITDESLQFALDDAQITAEEFAGFSDFLHGREHVDVEVEYCITGENRRGTFWDPPESADMDLMDITIDDVVPTKCVQDIALKILGGDDAVEESIWDELG